MKPLIAADMILKDLKIQDKISAEEFLKKCSDLHPHFFTQAKILPGMIEIDTGNFKRSHLNSWRHFQWWTFPRCAWDLRAHSLLIRSVTFTANFKLTQVAQQILEQIAHVIRLYVFRHVKNSFEAIFEIEHSCLYINNSRKQYISNYNMWDMD